MVINESLFDKIQKNTSQPFECNMPQVDILGLLGVEDIYSLEDKQHIAN